VIYKRNTKIEPYDELNKRFAIEKNKNHPVYTVVIVVVIDIGKSKKTDSVEFGPALPTAETLHHSTRLQMRAICRRLVTALPSVIPASIISQFSKLALNTSAFIRNFQTCSVFFRYIYIYIIYSSQISIHPTPLLMIYIIFSQPARFTEWFSRSGS